MEGKADIKIHFYAGFHILWSPTDFWFLINLRYLLGEKTGVREKDICYVDFQIQLQQLITACISFPE